MNVWLGWGREDKAREVLQDKSVSNISFQIHYVNMCVWDQIPIIYVDQRENQNTRSPPWDSKEDLHSCNYTDQNFDFRYFWDKVHVGTKYRSHTRSWNHYLNCWYERLYKCIFY